MRLRPMGLALALLCAIAATAAEPASSALRRAAPARIQPPAQINTVDVDRRADVNAMNLWVWNIGSIGFADPNPGLIWPKGTTNTAIFASGLWLAGQVGGQTRIAVAEYTQDFVPGPMSGGTFTPDLGRYVVYKVARWTGDPSDTAHVERTSDELGLDPNLDPLVHHSWREYMNGAVPDGAPWRWYAFQTARGTDTLIAGPDMLGDQFMWTVFNDADPDNHGGDFTPATDPLGVEVQQSVFGFNRSGSLANTAFIRYKLINKGGNQIDSMFVALWCDPDLGGFTDDLVGCDTTLSLGYVYNATNQDQLYGTKPPALGYDFLKGPVASGDTLGMTSFNKYINGTDPASPDEVYDYMNGLTGTGDVVTDPHGVETKFLNAGDPVTNSGWLDTNPADRRFMMSAGPFRMAPGDTQIVIAALMIAQGRDRLSSVSGLRFADIFAQDAFYKDFQLPSPPPQPKVAVSTGDGQVKLSWDSESRFNYPRTEDNAAGYAFEGYNVYQGESRSGPWRLIATYDVVNSITVIFDKVFDSSTGQQLPSYPVAYGSDAGVQYSHTITQDAVKGGALHNGSPYYFAVTAYSYRPDGLPKVLENAQSVIQVIPQRPASGTDPATARTICASYRQKDTSQPKATPRVTLEVVNPDSTLDRTYKITFGPLPSPVILPTTGDTVLVGWNLIDSTTTDTLLKNQYNLSEDEDYRVVRGMRVRVLGTYKPKPELAEAGWLCRPDSPIEGYSGWGGPVFTGGVDYAWNLYSPLDPAADPDSFCTVEVRFTAGPSGKAYRFLRRQLSDGSAPANVGRGPAFGGFVDVPFTAWDTDHNRQMEVAFLEKVVTDDDGNIAPAGDQVPTYDGQWLPSTSYDGDREMIFPVRTPYSTTADPLFAVDEGIYEMPALYMLYARRLTVDSRVNPGDVFRFVWNAVPPGPNDEFVFGTTAIQRGNTALAKSKLNMVRAVPNPYYAHSRYELNQFNRVVRFTNLPERCTIRLFNLSGELVRTLEKTDGNTSILDWDLLTENRLPVASGVYIYHVDSPGVGSTYGRLVVLMEKERLNSL